MRQSGVASFSYHWAAPALPYGYCQLQGREAPERASPGGVPVPVVDGFLRILPLHVAAVNGIQSRIGDTPNLRKDGPRNAIRRMREHTGSQARLRPRPSAGTVLGRSLACSPRSFERSAPKPETSGPQQLRRPPSANQSLRAMHRQRQVCPVRWMAGFPGPTGRASRRGVQQPIPQVRSPRLAGRVHGLANPSLPTISQSSAPVSRQAHVCVAVVCGRIPGSQLSFVTILDLNVQEADPFAGSPFFELINDASRRSSSLVVLTTNPDSEGITRICS